MEAGGGGNGQAGETFQDGVGVRLPGEQLSLFVKLVDSRQV